jgi:hypothetical protein
VNAQLSLFPVVDAPLFRRLGFEAEPYTFYYMFEGEVRQLDVESAADGQTFKLLDPLGNWNPQEFGFTARREIVIRHPHALFGVNGVAPSMASVGAAVMWLSRSSGMRGAVAFDSPITNERLPAVRTFEHSFSPGVFRGDFILKTVLYLHEYKGHTRQESHLAHNSGTILGELDTVKILIDGKGSVFPILEVNEPSLPLWRVECNWDDPLTEPFDTDTVVIYLNSAHPGYKSLIQGDLRESFLLKEVTASALQVIVQYAQNSEFWNDIVAGKGEEGSVGQALHYFITTLDWKTDSPERLALSIREYIDKRM